MIFPQRIAGFMEDIQFEIKSNKKARKLAMLNNLDSLKPKER